MTSAPTEAPLAAYERDFFEALFGRSSAEQRPELAFYRSMVRRRLREAIAKGLPRFVAYVGEPAFEEWLDAYFFVGPTTAILYRVSEHFADWLLHHQPSLAARTTDFVRLDAAIAFATNAPAGLAEGQEPTLHFHQPVQLTRALRIIELTAAIDLADPHASFEVPEDKCVVLVFRSEVDQRVFVRPLTSLQQRYLQALESRQTPFEASQFALAGAEPSEDSLNELTDLVAELLEHAVWFEASPET